MTEIDKLDTQALKRMSRARRLVAEGLGTTMLLAVVVGSGIMAERLAGGNVAIALLANTIATGAGLVTLILMFGTISGAHFNPVVTLSEAWQKNVAAGDVVPYVVVQVVGAFAGVAAAHAMFGEPVFQASEHVRSGASQWWSECVATFGLIGVIIGCSRSRPGITPFAVAAYITSAYWFTASTSFANPAVTLARRHQYLCRHPPFGYARVHRGAVGRRHRRDRALHLALPGTACRRNCRWHRGAERFRQPNGILNCMSIPELPNLKGELLDIPSVDKLAPVGDLSHPPRILMLYGSLRERSFSRFLTEEAARILTHLGAEVKIFNPMQLPMVGSVPEEHPKVQELRALCLWSEGQVWCSPERHGAITAVMKNQIDWIPLEQGAVRPSQGRTLAVMQVCGGSQSFNVVNTLRLLGRWMRMFTIPNQSSVPMAYKEFDEAGRMRPSAYYDRVVDVMEELFKMTLLLRGRTDYLTDRYSERNEHARKAIDRQIEKL